MAARIARSLFTAASAMGPTGVRDAGHAASMDARSAWTCGKPAIVAQAQSNDRHKNMNRRVKPWNRKLWGVAMFSGREKPILIGATWNAVLPEAYPGACVRCLLFVTRKRARAWCKEATARHSKHSPHWRFRPVRVREIVRAE